MEADDDGADPRLIRHSPDVFDRQRINPVRPIFRFSRPDTQVAKALHSALSARKLPHEPLLFDEMSREERTRGSQAVLHAKKK